MKRVCKTAARANFLSYRIVNFWNSLPECVVTADSVNSFKGRFDKCCSHLRFSTDVNDFWSKFEISQQAFGLHKTAYLMMMMMNNCQYWI